MQLSRLPASLLLVALILSACGSVTPVPSATRILPTATGTVSSASPVPTPTLTASPTPLPTIGTDPASLRGVKIQVWNAFAGAASDLFINQAAQFNANNEWGIIVTLANIGDYTSLFEIMNTALDTGQSPELVAALPEQTLAWDTRAFVVDLTPYFADPRWGLLDDSSADIPTVFLAQDNINGRQLGVPAQRSARFLFYNQAWARELGFDNPPSTADEFRKQACAGNASFLKDKDLTNDGKGGWVVDTAWQTVYSWMLAFGGGVVDGNDYALRTDTNLAALQFIRGLSDSHCAWPSETPYDSFASRTALFISADLAELPAAMGSMEAVKNPDEWTVIPFPGPQGRVVVAYGPSYSVMKSVPEKQLAAWLFIRWLLSPENQSQWVESTGLFPLRTSLLDMIGPYRLALPQWDSAVETLNRAQDVPQLASWRKVRYVLEDGMTTVFQTTLSADQLPFVLEEMDSMAQEFK
jgi:multiple sugar transport system substrate-binding protein